MILVDVNLLLYSRFTAFAEHRAAQEWLDESLGGTQRVALPWHSLLGYLRLASNPRAFRNAISVGRAWEHVEDWLDRPAAWVPIPGEGHRRHLATLVAASPMSSRLVSDVHLAALALEHGLAVASTDGDFARFPGLRWYNPLAAG